ncbi:hypothetical protein [Methyloferula stellata]|jgi:hypothetical protein|uniref:hypothetical protein n=1 Tax=Methyloferula stellata TaxID=876270 RepID=UPI00037DB670|nr:hypothetical protein [Methyloferula stellata]
MTMNPWIGLALFLTLYLLIPILFGLRGALISFFLPPLGFFLFGFYLLLQDPNLGTRISGFDAASILFTGAFGGPFLFVFCLWVVAFPLAALGLWLNGQTRRLQWADQRQKI